MIEIENASKKQVIHRVKHIPTGFYYKPGVNNFSEKGKIYNNNHDCLEQWVQYLTISMEKTSRLVTKHPEIFADWENSICYHNRIVKRIPIDEFEKEPLTL